MATTKHLDPTNVDISIPAMTDSPNASVFSNCVDKEADAINALSDHIAKFTSHNNSASGDLNDITANGIYIIGSASSVSNAPASDYQYSVMVVLNSVQVIIGNTHWWVRYIGSAWKSATLS